MLPPSTVAKHSLSELRKTFQLIDVDTDGYVTWGEFFMWALTEAAIRTGSGMRALFLQFDTHRDGRIGFAEFRRIASDLGLGERAKTIFQQLATRCGATRSGAVRETFDYQALIKETYKLNVRDTNARNAFMRELVLDEAAQDAQARQLVFQRDFSFHASDCESFRDELRALLDREETTLPQIFRLVDKDGSYSLDWAEFESMFRTKLCFTGDSSVLQAVFDQINADGNAHIRYNEWRAWFAGKVTVPVWTSMQAEANRLASSMEDDEEPDPWTAEHLLEMLRGALRESGMDVAGVMKAWDTDESGELSLPEFLTHVRGAMLSHLDNVSIVPGSLSLTPRCLALPR